MVTVKINGSNSHLLISGKEKVTVDIENNVITSLKKAFSPWTQDVNWTYIRRSGRLLNVLCTFNLRPVPRGFGIAVHSNATFEDQSKKPIKNLTRYQ